MILEEKRFTSFLSLHVPPRLRKERSVPVHIMVLETSCASLYLWINNSHLKISLVLRRSQFADQFKTSKLILANLINDDVHHVHEHDRGQFLLYWQHEHP